MGNLGGSVGNSGWGQVKSLNPLINLDLIEIIQFLFEDLYDL